MTLEDLGNIGEFVAAIAVVISLIYLAVQIRQNTRSVRASSYHAVVTNLSNLAADIGRNAPVMKLVRRDQVADGPERFDLLRQHVVQRQG